MNKQLTILVTGLLAAHSIVLAPAQAQTQSEVKFYCGKSYDPVGREDIPTTLVSVPNREQPLVVIAWKSEHFGKEFNPQKRCNLVSPKFQTAYTAGKLEYFVTGNDKKTGSQIVCGTATQDESCDGGANMLFTLKPYSNGASVLKQLAGNTEGNAGTILFQSSGSREVFHLGALLKAKK
jgi:Circadian oscillating protein COP23